MVAPAVGVVVVGLVGAVVVVVEGACPAGLVVAVVGLVVVVVVGTVVVVVVVGGGVGVAKGTVASLGAVPAGGAPAEGMCRVWRAYSARPAKTGAATAPPKIGVGWSRFTRMESAGRCAGTNPTKVAM